MTVHHRILKIPVGSSIEDIKSAYRKLAKTYHPDVNPGNEERFLEIQKSYDFLMSNPNYGKMSFNDGNMAFKDFIRKKSEHQNASHKYKRYETSSRDGEHINCGIEVSLEFIYYKKKGNITYTKYVPCRTCNHSGFTDNHGGHKICMSCMGSGKATNGKIFDFNKSCLDCGGTGIKYAIPCNDCHGEGRVQEKTSYLFEDIPFSAYEAGSYIVKEEGNAGARNGQYGDLYIDIKIKSDPVYRKDGNCLVKKVKCSPSQMFFGGDAKTDIFGKETVDYKIPPRSSSGSFVFIKNKGFEKGGYLILELITENIYDDPEIEMLMKQIRDIEMKKEKDCN